LGSLIPDEQGAKLDLLDLAWPSIDNAVNGPPTDLAEARAVTPASLADALPESAAGQAFAEALWAYDGAGSPPIDAVLFESFPLLIDRLAAILEADEITAETLPPALAERYLTEGVYRVDFLPEGDLNDPATRAAFVAELEDAIPSVAGAPLQIEGARQAVGQAMLSAILLALGGASVLSFLTLRSATGTIAIIVPVILAGSVCMAAGVLLDMPFNYANVIVLPLMIGIGVDTGIHLALRARAEAEVFDTSTPMAAFYSALTTIAAFGTLGLSDHRGTASMGVLLAIGLAATVLMSFALTPRLTRIRTSSARSG
ncbi:MAG: hypothetical protein AAF568_07490, partial [Pseudomonadota bacterium]